MLVLDSHVEVRPGFLEPLLNETIYNERTIAAPVFDFWDTFENKVKCGKPRGSEIMDVNIILIFTSFQYWSYDGKPLSFDKFLLWQTHPVPQTDDPFCTPAILGGAYLAKKKFLEDVDYFGNGMIGWGGENIELSLKVSQDFA